MFCQLDVTDGDTIDDCEKIYENNFLGKHRTMMDNYKQNWIDDSIDIDSILNKNYNFTEEVMNYHPSNKIQFKIKLKKGQTYIFTISNRGKAFLGEPYEDIITPTRDSRSCLWGGIYMAAYTFDLDIQFKK